MTAKIVLASASRHRAQMLENAGLSISVQPADTDERAVEEPLAGTGATPADIARVLAEAKAQTVSAARPTDIVIGCDQVLSLGDEVLHKAPNMEEARRRLLALSGRTHQLNSGVAIARGGETLWSTVDVAHMTMRDLTPEYIGRYLAAAGEDVLGSVGVYQIERHGINLFDEIDGEFFTIVGLPLLSLIRQLRELGAIDG